MFLGIEMHFYMKHAPSTTIPTPSGTCSAGWCGSARQREGPQWAPAYHEALLRDTGAGSCEDVVLRHLGVGLRDPAAWLAATDSLSARVEAYEAFADALSGDQAGFLPLEAVRDCWP